jgi:hypothetical protein
MQKMIIQFINLFLLTEDISFLLSKLIKQKDNSKIYFDYLHTLYFSLHKNYYKGEIIPEFTLNHISPQKKINIIIINIIIFIKIKK